MMSIKDANGNIFINLMIIKPINSEAYGHNFELVMKMGTRRIHVRVKEDETIGDLFKILMEKMQ